MRITAVIDDELVEKARKLTNINSNSELVRKAVKTLVEREAARRLAKLGGSQPHLQPSVRQKTPLFWKFTENILGVPE